MSEDLRPINMTLCGEWRREGVARLEVVERSWSVYVRNTRELIAFLQSPRRDPAILAMVMTGGPAASAAFWDEFAQRLHNQLASITSLIDHTRILTKYYEVDGADLVEQFRSRNETIRQMEQAAFLRDLRNYLLHCGHAPIVLAVSVGIQGEHHAFKVDAKAILSWKRWNAPARKYLSGFGERGGPMIINDVLHHGKAMEDLYNWLFDQRGKVLALTPDRFRIGRQGADETELKT
jgi:hypothetical protein